MAIPQASPLRLAAAFLAAATLAAVPACAGKRGGSPAEPRPPFAPSTAVVRGPMLPADPDRGADKDLFSGTEACLECHRDRWKSLEASFHASTIAKGAASIGCEECHGPGLEHVGRGDEKGIRHPGKGDRAASNAVCLRCHAAVVDPAAPFRGHPAWIGERKGACADCHTVHVDRRKRIDAHARGPFRNAKELADAGAVPVDPARCIACHPDYHPEMDRSGHADLVKEGMACASCHGNGSLHAASGGLRHLILEPSKQEAADADASCMSCHETLEKPLLRWTCSEHRLAGVSCVDCHDPNARRGATLRKKDPALCLSCHPDTGAEFRLPSRHRLHEGFLTCNDCHDPHANVSAFKDRALVRDACVRCHPEKGGPFVFEHAARELEGCTVCHRPHGSTAPRLLETREVRTLCLSCHPDLPADHEQRPGSVYRDCLRCHVEIHGSDVNRTFHR